MSHIEIARVLFFLSLLFRGLEFMGFLNAFFMDSLGFSNPLIKFGSIIEVFSGTFNFNSPFPYKIAVFI